MSRIAYIQLREGASLKCLVPPDLAIQEGNECIVESDNALEFGSVSRMDGTGDDRVSQGKPPKVLRRATLQDQAKAEENALMNKMAMDTCVARAEKYGLAMRLVRVRYSFDRAILTVMFTAEDRVDFREMVKELAGELRTRVEMKQIGVRDEAGIVGGIGTCGRELCCCAWLRRFDAVNVKMAKVQRLPLNPATISGMCGRLKCCLRYEYGLYKELARHLPRMDACVKCPSGTGRVMDCNVLAQRVKVRLDDERVVECDAGDLRKESAPWAGSPARDEDIEDTDRDSDADEAVCIDLKP